jgi:hypothetical protein
MSQMIGQEGRKGEQQLTHAPQRHICFCLSIIAVAAALHVIFSPFFAYLHARLFFLKDMKDWQRR